MASLAANRQLRRLAGIKVETEEEERGRVRGEERGRVRGEKMGRGRDAKNPPSSASNHFLLAPRRFHSTIRPFVHIEKSFLMTIPRTPKTRSGHYGREYHPFFSLPSCPTNSPSARLPMPYIPSFHPPLSVRNSESLVGLKMRPSLFSSFHFFRRLINVMRFSREKKFANGLANGRGRRMVEKLFEIEHELCFEYRFE